MAKQWMGEKPTSCQICNKPLEGWFVDGKLQVGPWAILCTRCHRINGCGLGTGRGQRYDLDTLEKVEG